MLLTIDPHPSKIVRLGSHPSVLTSQRYRAELVEPLGVDVVCVLPFTRDFQPALAVGSGHQLRYTSEAARHA